MALGEPVLAEALDLLEAPLGECALVAIGDHSVDDLFVERVQRPAPSPGSHRAAELIGFCRERLAVYKAPVRIVFCASLPVSPAGKLLRRQLPALLQAGHS